jgi:hypothetical protein
MRTFALIVCVAIVGGCATTPLSLYQSAAKMPTPKLLHQNSKWALILLDAKGSVVKTLVVSLTDRPAQTCIAGDYRQLDVIAEYGDVGSPTLHDPAYKITGAALSIEFSPNQCDNYYSVVGGVTSSGFEGIN